MRRNHKRRNHVTDRLELPDITWHRVSPKYIVVDVVGAIVTAVILVVATSIPAWLTDIGWLWAIPSAAALISLAVIAFVPRRVRSIGYTLREDDLLFRRGLMFQRFVAVPYGRMQLVDINRGPLARALGLSELRFVTAAAATGVVIPGLAEADAEELRDRLVELAESRRAGL
jgi:membrane protein YdbS with pleckstrin-like domain